MSLLQRLKSPGPKRMLALDGGGIRGALTAGYLVEMEKLLRQRHGNPQLVLADYFDFIGGTSTGSIIAAGLSIGMTATDVSEAYLKLGAAGFKKVLLPFKARFSADAVRTQLQLLFGDRLLGDDSLRTGLCVVAKRADTNSVWPILNHPDGKYYPRNSRMPLRDVIRASTAAPTYFIPETLDVGGKPGAFVDGGVSMANNPALTMFMVATLKGFPFHWKTGEDQLLLVSLGTGQWRQDKLPQTVSDANIIASAAAVPEMLMQDANWHNQMLLQSLSRSPTAAVIDREIGDLSGDLLTPEPLLSYLRYNVTLEAEALRELGLPQLSTRAEALHDMSDADNRHELLELGLAAARKQLQSAHFPAAFDLPARMKSCFVIQGYGRKTDYRDGRVLDLDASYAIIKDAVEAAGLECIRADEIQHSGTIDLPMYQWLLNADTVVADLSTNNSNAVFELGVRYALRPQAAIIVAEEQFQNPFDFSHIVIRRYKHLGDDIGAKEARRFRDDPQAAIQTIAAERRIDSPIYTFLPTLRPPVDQKALDDEALAPFAPVAISTPASAEPLPLSTLLTRDGGADTETVDLNTKQPLEQAQKRINASDFASARALLEEARKRPTDSFVIQRLALSIYKSKLPDAVSALNDALEVLRVLKPETCNNPETLGLYGAIHKRLWEINPAPQLLDIGITAYARGFALKQDHYTGINFAFLLDLRAREHLKAGLRDDAITDHTLAIRMRKDVAQIARTHLERLPEEVGNEHFWVLASLWEAALGTGDAVALAGYEAALRSMKVADWMQDTWQWQGKKLRALLDEYQALLT